MEWYEQWFGEEYLLVYEHRNLDEARREVAAIRDVVGLTGGELLLDLCCGTGRHDFPLAALGCRVIGLDYSDHLLKQAMGQREVSDRYPVYVRADARKQIFADDSFDVILNLFTSFGYFNDDENRDMLLMMGRILKPDGKFYIDYLNPPVILDGLVEKSERELNGIHISEQRRFEPETSRLEKDITLSRQGKTQHFHESVHLYSEDEMVEMLLSAGLSVENTLGSIDGERYSQSSPRMILHGRKRPTQL